MHKRQYLENKILLCGECDTGVFRRTFHITQQIRGGASAVCYEAYYENSGRGVLKEFYPADIDALERSEDGQLVCRAEEPSERNRFMQEEKQYLEPYKMLLDAKQNGAYQDLATFIPHFEIYHGCDEKGRITGTTYVWTPEPKLETFAHICEEIHQHPGENPEHKLVMVLTAIESLTKCVCALHCAEMIHRDIKPSNFGFLKRSDEPLTQTLSLFDINSVCSVYAKYDREVLTRGYAEPELNYQKANNQTDIYSIGATLFHAVVVTEETRQSKYLFQRGYYDRLREMVNQSELIRASEANSHPRLRNILATILKKCLCKRDDRYTNCEELLEDLKAALYYALPSEIARTALSSERWILTDVEKSLDVNREKNSTLAIQQHLYAHPLYQCVQDAEETIRVLVIGFGNYGQKFLDVCLQSGQIRGKRLCATVVSDEPLDKELYLSERPELENFFAIDRAVTDERDSYGELTFFVERLKREDPNAIAGVLQRILREKQRLHYAFIALGNDGDNLAAAKACKMAAERLQTECVVSFVCEKQQDTVEETLLFCPIFVNADSKAAPFYAEIERMAFNTHLIWEKNLNIDHDKVRAEFQKPYYHDSCVSSVLALKYKLYSIGIDLEKTGFNEAARLFREKMTKKKDQRLRNELICIEHRRWVTEKACQGWRRIENLEDCAGGVTKDESAKKHICIRKSRPDQKLAEKFQQGIQWDTVAAEELDQLDELDRMSVELHRMYARKSGEAKKQDLLNGSAMMAIRELIEEDPKAMTAFREWYICAKEIWNGDREKVRLYKGLKNSFLDAINEFSPERKQAVREQVKAFDTIFYPILASTEYRNWKQDDVALVDNIPFVLTFTENTSLVIPFTAGDNAGLFQMLAAATVVNPKRILYLCSAEREQDIAAVQETMLPILGYMRKKHFRATVEIVIAAPEAMQQTLHDAAAQQIVCTGRGRIREVTRLFVHGGETVPQVLESYLQQKSANEEFFAVEKNAAKLSALLEKANVYNHFASYAFDSAEMRFYAVSGCDMLRYIQKKPYITVTDMQALCLLPGQKSDQPEFFDTYEALWKKYTKNKAAWEFLCSLLKGHAEHNDILAAIPKKTSEDKKRKTRERQYIVPFTCGRSAEKIVRFLVEHGIAEKGSRVNGYTAGSCEVVIADRCEYGTIYDQLFSRVYALMLPDAISLSFDNEKQSVYVAFDDLVMEDVLVPEEQASKVMALMRFFERKKYVLGLCMNADGRMRFTCATRQIKELLCTPEKMLEVYLYHKSKELGAFDDVAAGFEAGDKGRFACVLTKGFRTFFVKYKTESDAETEQLVEFANRFGVNAAVVLIDDGHKKSSRKDPLAANIVMIRNPDEIENIGNTLLNAICSDRKNQEE